MLKNIIASLLAAFIFLAPSANAFDLKKSVQDAFAKARSVVTTTVNKVKNVVHPAKKADPVKAALEENNAPNGAY